VVSVPDELRGEEVKAFVVLNEGAELTAEELNAYCGERLAAFKVPRFWAFRDDLPLTPSERVAKHALDRSPT
jgi:crotonobetaine/carnitine-CoA ligase